VPLALKISEKDFAARTLPPAEGLLAQAGYLLRANHLPEGLKLLDRVAAINSNVPGYHTELGYYHLQNGDYPKALKEFDLALAADPNDLSAHLYIATALYRESGYTEESTSQIRSHLEKVIALNPDFAPAYAFLSIAYIQKPAANNQRAFDAAARASRLEPGNLSYYIDIGVVLLADGKFAEAKKLADQARKTAFTSRDRMIVAGFSKRVDAKAKQASSMSSSSTAGPETQSTNAPPPSPSQEPLHAEGKITELICGHPPEVVLTLTTSSGSLLLHIMDATQIEILESHKPAGSGAPPCASWKDRRAQVEFTSTPDSVTAGEIRVLSFE
jgi:tetratricopeptide (TPR) repeat protein